MRALPTALLSLVFLCACAYPAQALPFLGGGFRGGEEEGEPEGGMARGDVDFRLGLRFGGWRGFFDGGFEGVAFRRGEAGAREGGAGAPAAGESEGGEGRGGHGGRGGEGPDGQVGGGERAGGNGGGEGGWMVLSPERIRTMLKFDPARLRPRDRRDGRAAREAGAVRARQALFASLPDPAPVRQAAVRAVDGYYWMEGSAPGEPSRRDGSSSHARASASASR